MFRSKQEKKIYRYIRSLMVLNGVRQGDIAKKVGVSQSAVSQAIIGKIDSRKIKEEIARSLGRPVNKLWPGTKV